MKRIFDFLLSLILLLVLLPPILLAGLAILITSKGPALYWSDRIWQK